MSGFKVGDSVKRVSELIWDELDAETVYKITKIHDNDHYILIEGGEAWNDFWYDAKSFALVSTDPDVDMVNQPPHYKFENGVEVIDLTEQLNFNCGNAIKYIARAGRKDVDKVIEDLQKAEFYIKKEIERVSRSRIRPTI